MVRGRFAEAEAALAGLIGQAENAGAAEGTDELLFWLAHCREQQGRRKEAAATYRAMLKRYPQSPFAADARERAEALEAERSP
jgi:TolA-binding protein